jgi:hypothetical protein
MAADPRALVRHGLPPARKPFVAVAATLADRGHDQWHAGIAYGDEVDPMPRLLHLADDRKLLDQPLDDEDLGWEQGYVWIEVPVPVEKARALVQLCRAIADRVKAKGQEVRYSIRHHLGRFDPTTGAYVPDAPERGLTCATCVMAVCRGVEIELVDVATWPARPEDKAWIARIVAWLRSKDSEHAAAVEKDGLCARFRPSEVAGACLVPSLKAPFTEAVKGAAVVVGRYHDLFPPPPAPGGEPVASAPG